MAQAQHVLRKPEGQREPTSDRLIFLVAFVVFVPIALAGQLFGLHWRTWLPGAEGAKSVFSGVKAAIYTFMSHIL